MMEFLNSSLDHKETGGKNSLGATSGVPLNVLNSKKPPQTTQLMYMNEKTQTMLIQPTLNILTQTADHILTSNVRKEQDRTDSQHKSRSANS